MLATSREPLGSAVEYAFRLSPLPLPGPEPDPSAVPSVAVFLDRGRRVRPGLAPTPDDLRVIAEIVRAVGRPAARHRAGRGTAFHLLPRRPLRPARPLPRPARRGPAERRRAAPDAARHRRVVLRPARRGRAAPLPLPVGLRRRRRPRHRRAARPRPRPGRRPRHRAVPTGRRVHDRRRFREGHALPHVGDPPRVRAGPARGRGRVRRRGPPPRRLGGRARRGRPAADGHRTGAGGGRRSAPRAGQPARGLAAGP